MKICYLGSGAFGLPTLRHLRTHHNLLAIVSQPDRPAGRKRLPTPTPIGAWSAEHAPDVPILKPQDVNVPEVRERLRACDADAWVIVAFGQKLSEALIADRFAINLHASLLPRWRGAAPIHRAIEAGDDITGNSVITIAQRMDAGSVLGQSERPIEPHHTTALLHDQLAADGPELIEHVLSAHRDGTLVHQQQDEQLVTKARKLSKEQGTTDFALSARAVRCKVHAFNPWPSVTVLHRDQPLKLHAALEDDDAPAHHAPPGTIVEPERGSIACAQGTTLTLLEVQPSGGVSMPWTEYARGRALSTGETLVPVTPTRSS